ncbi:MAG: hypothetical protein ACKVJG_28600 [Candidatus Latescibacterota bacterium]|jgi:hypothetical protein|tara:strand:- start:109 stop:300 length:192 start_codon:yes stop_codon:yes gene_type:complete
MDEEYVHIGVDERPVYLKKAPWRQDGIEGRVDGRSDPVRSAAREGGPGSSLSRSAPTRERVKA